MGLVAVSGCRSAVDEADSDDDSATGEASSSPTSGGTLVTSVVAAPAPEAYFTGRPGNIFWCRNVLESLTQIDEKYEVHPILATEWEFQEGNKRLVLTLREGVTYHSGRDFTSEDVLFAIEHAKEGGGLTNLAEVISEWTVEATGDHEVVISAPQPLQEVVFDILDTLPMIDRETYEGIEDGSEVIGTGPFVWSEYQAGTELKMVRNESYWDPELPYLDEVELVVISDSTAQLSALRSGRTQLASGFTTQDQQTIVDDEKFHLITNHGLIYGFGLDVSRPPFDNIEVRRALGYLIDRERINKQVFNSVGRTTSLPWGESATGYPADLSDTYTYDPERARQMIEDAGAAGELGNMFHIWSAKAGMAPALMVDGLQELRAQGNTTHYDNEEYKRLVRDLQSSPDDETTAAALESLSEHMLHAAFFLPFLIAPSTSVVTDEVKDLLIGRYGRSFRATYLEDA